jgi:putative aldouronate transport system substrate-binding protein
MKRTISLILALILALGVACGAFAEGDTLFDETVEISILCTTWSPYSTETTLVDEIEKLTNTKLNIEWAAKEDFGTKVNSLMATGDLPDVIIGNETNLISMIDQGAIVPLTDYYNGESMPNITAALDDGDYVSLKNVNDGEIYTFASVFDFPPVSAFMVRGDWLEKLSMDVPDTWDAWMAYWYAVRDNDMNGDGDATNEIPLTCSALQMMMFYGIAVDAMASANHYFCYMPDGGYGVIEEHPNYKAYLEMSSFLYAEGILDPEFATRDMSSWYKVMDSGIAGSMFGAAEQAKLSSQTLQTMDPDAIVICTEPVTGSVGDKIMSSRNKVNKLGTVTIAGEEKIEDIVKFFDWFFSEQGETLINYGVEGVHHEVKENGERKLLSPYVDSFVDARGAGLIFQPFPILWNQDNYMQILLTGKSYDELDELTKVFYDGLFVSEGYFAKVAPTLVTDAYAQYGVDIFAALYELRANAIAGRITMDAYWDQYEALKPMGLQAIIDGAAAAWAQVG